MDLSELLIEYRRQQTNYLARNTKFSELRRLFENDLDEWWTNNMSRTNRIQLTTNLLTPIVEKHSSFLVADPPEFQVLTPSPTDAGVLQASKSEQCLYNIMEENQMETRLNEIAKDSFLLGIGWARTYLEEVPGKKDKKKYKPKWAYAKPEFVYPEAYHSAYQGKLRYLIYAYQIGLDEARKEFGPDVRSDWDIEVSELGASPDACEKSKERCTVIEYHDEDIFAYSTGGVYKDGPNTAGHIPFISFPCLSIPGKIHGAGVAANIVEANKKLNLLTSRKMDSALMHCNPPWVILNAPTGFKNEFVNDIDGGVFFMPEGVTIQLLSWMGEPPSVVEQQKVLKQYIFDASFMPEQAFVTNNLMNATGMGMRVGFDPLIKLQKQVRGNWSVALKELCRQLLSNAEKFCANDMFVEAKLEIPAKKPEPAVEGEAANVMPEPITTEKEKKTYQIFGRDIKGFHNVRIVFAGVLPKDDFLMAQLELRKKEAKIQSVNTTMENLGVRDPAYEKAMIIDEASSGVFDPQGDATRNTSMSKVLNTLDNLKGGPGLPGMPELPQLPAVPPIVPNEPGNDRGIVPGAPGPTPAPPSLEPDLFANQMAQTEGGAGSESTIDFGRR
jgi:hypothetical protein